MTIEVHLTPAASARVSPHGWRRLPSGIWVTALPLVDAGNHGRFAHLDYTTLLAVSARIKGSRLLAPATVVELNRHGFRCRPEISAGDAQMSSKARCDAHDDAVMGQLVQAWDGLLPVANAGKPWVAGALPDKSRLFGWGKRINSSLMGPQDFHDWHQPLQNAHNRRHVDYSSLCTLEADSDIGLEADDEPTPDTDPAPAAPPPAPGTIMPTRSTIRLGSKGADVTFFQEKALHFAGILADGHFGPGTEKAAKAWQDAHGLVADGVIGAKGWAVLGQSFAPTHVAMGGYPGNSPACTAALRDATAKWPTRKRISDGIAGDLSHQASKSSHNVGNAVDVTHDPASGCDGNVISRFALQDARTLYVIWNKRIWNKSLGDAIDGPGRPYKGANGHTHHVHIDVIPALRGDASPWPWAPTGA